MWLDDGGKDTCSRAQQRTLRRSALIWGTATEMRATASPLSPYCSQDKGQCQYSVMWEGDGSCGTWAEAINAQRLTYTSPSSSPITSSVSVVRACTVATQNTSADIAQGKLADGSTVSLELTYRGRIGMQAMVPCVSCTVDRAISKSWVHTCSTDPQQLEYVDVRVLLVVIA